MDLAAAPRLSDKADQVERQAELRRAFVLVRDVQNGVRGARQDIASLLAEAERRSWPEVVRAALFADAVAARSDHQALLPAIERLRTHRLTDGDPVAASMAASLRASVRPDGPGSTMAEPADAELARATVLLDSTETDAPTLASAHNSCGFSYGQRGLWELQDAHYAAAEELLPRCEGTPLAATVLFNRAEVHLNWACALREIGDVDAIEERHRAATPVLAAASRLPLPESWRLELRIFDVLLDALRGEGDVTRAQGLLASMSGAEEYAGHAWLALALVEHDAHAAERAVAGISPDTCANVYDLALRVAAELERPPSGGRSAGLRYAERHARLRWETRLASLGVMRSLIDVERLRAEHDLLTRHAYHDDLTGLANRRELRRRSTDLETNGTPRVSVLLVDVDDFKHINDIYGHQAGDEALVTLARILATATRAGDLAVRLGGDEFALLLIDSDPYAARKRADEIVAAVADYPWDRIRAGMRLTVSIGVSAAPSQRIEHLVSDADLGLYRAKAAGGSVAALAGALG